MAPTTRDSPDEVDPIAPAAKVFGYATGAVSSGSGGIRVDTGVYKVVFFSFGFEGINSASQRADGDATRTDLVG